MHQETTSTFALLLSFLLLLSSTPQPIISTLITPPPPQPPPLIACESTIYPELCRSILRSFQHSPLNPGGGGGAAVASYGKFTIRQCLQETKKVTTLINQFLTFHKGGSFLGYGGEVVGALTDCAQLADLSVDYLESISAELMTVPNAMSDDLVYRVQALLSAVVTNHQTCFDSLKDAGNSAMMNSLLLEPLYDASKLYSVSLGVVSHALKRVRGGNGIVVMERGPQKQMDHWDHQSTTSLVAKILASKTETRKGRKLLQEMVDGGVHVRDAVTVSLYGGGNFTTISAAIEFAPNNSKPGDGYFVIYIQQGLYKENVLVSKHKKNIMILGDGINHTVISGTRSVYDGWTTYRSATFAVSGERFVAIGITFQNLAGPYRHQAVALRNNADLSTFYRCSFIGYQDTLYVHSLRQFYRECDVYGTVDFIFGNAAAVFQNCRLYARKPMRYQKNAITAQSRSDPNQDTGIAFQHCSIEAAPDLAVDLSFAQTFLGRPWKPYSRTVYMKSYIGSHIDPAGWLAWNATASVDNIYYGEYQNYGPGAGTASRVQWPGYRYMNAADAMHFTVYNFTMGDTWLPYTNIPFSAGLE